MKYENDSDRYTFCTWQFSDNLKNCQNLLDKFELNSASFIGVKITKNVNDFQHLQFLLKLENGETREMSSLDAIDIKLKWSQSVIDFLEKSLHWVKTSKTVTFASDLIEERNNLLGDPVEIICKFSKFSRLPTRRNYKPLT